MCEVMNKPTQVLEFHILVGTIECGVFTESKHLHIQMYIEMDVCLGLMPKAHTSYHTVIVTSNQAMLLNYFPGCTEEGSNF